MSAKIKRIGANIKGFYKSYKLLFIISLLLFIFQIMYTVLPCAENCIPIIQRFAQLLIDVALAIWVSTLFCYFQVYLPEERKKANVLPGLKQYLSSLATHMSSVFEELYMHTHNNVEKEFQDFSDDEAESAFYDCSTKESCLTAESKRPDISSLRENPSDDIKRLPFAKCIALDVQETKKNCMLLIQLYGPYMDEELILLISDIYNCTYHDKVESYSAYWLSGNIVQSDFQFDCYSANGILQYRNLYRCLLKRISDLSN